MILYMVSAARSVATKIKVSATMHHKYNISTSNSATQLIKFHCTKKAIRIFDFNFYSLHISHNYKPLGLIGSLFKIFKLEEQ